MRKRIIIICFFAIAGWVARNQSLCNDSVKESSSSKHKTSESKRLDSLILIDTVLFDLGKVLIFIKNNSLFLKSEYSTSIASLSGKSIFGNTKSEYSTDLLNVFDGKKWTNRNIIYTKNGMLLFVIRTNKHIPHFFAARLKKSIWNFLCPEDQEICSSYDLTPSCIIFDLNRERLLVKRNGVGYDEVKDVDYQSISLIQYENKKMLYKGKMKFEGLTQLECNYKDINRWFIPYLKEAGRDSFDFYLNLLPSLRED